MPSFYKLSFLTAFVFAISMTAGHARPESAILGSLGINFDGLSDCARGCVIKSALGTIANCSLVDIKCHCQDDSYLRSSARCIITSCSVDEAVDAELWAHHTC
ncbi:secreted protein [Melampsora americana]|nr:secreted protein [Melampsora americana]